MRIGQCELEHDFYAVLGISASATPSEIRRAHRRLVKRHHPDLASPRAAGDPAASEQEMKRVNLAASVLLDPPSRARYDALRGNATQWPFVPEKPAASWEPRRSSKRASGPTRPMPRFNRGTPGKLGIPPSLIALAFAATVAVGFLSKHLGGPVPVSSPDYQLAGPVHRVSMFVD